MDVHGKEKRSAVMRSVKSKDTGAEMRVRRLLHHAGYRYRLHRKDLPGKPDIVFPGRRKVIFVHGCFWHQHPGCHYADRPATSIEYWTKKLEGNMARDTRNIAQLQGNGWNVLVVWECQTRNTEMLLNTLKLFLSQQDVPATSESLPNRPDVENACLSGVPSGVLPDANTAAYGDRL